uniref:3-oxoacyl-[acyl-carrier-protein] reductase n=1 Tax=Magnetococcus massalia (strain MO-1) TaxID=451514 RepID=A0A1S7LM10_MAGMO|nr:3-oxoacyl-[acyl-carrier-protein] reductase [Candidatus Magnetococcus massalia]
MQNLQGITALVTGAGRRLGRSIAQTLADAGASVAIHYGQTGDGAESLAEEIRGRGGQAEIFQADLADRQAVAALIPTITQQLGPLGILINSAAIFEKGDLTGNDWAQWQRHMAINLEAPVLLMQQFAQQWQVGEEASRPDGTGSIVNILDRRVLAPPTGHLAYNVAKSGLWTATRIAAAELAPQIRVNGVGPGPILPAESDNPQRFNQIVANTPMQRSGTPQEVAESVLFLVQHGYITGELICVDGGEHL